jgi:transketolase
LVRTHIGYGSPNKQDTFEAHGSPLGEKEVRLTKENLDWPVAPSFYVPTEVLEDFRKAVERGNKAESEWHAELAAYERVHPEPARELRQLVEKKLPRDWDKDIPHFPADGEGMKTRVASGRVLNTIAPRLPALLGGSADLDPSTHTALEGQGDFGSPDVTSDDTQGSVGGGWSYTGRNLHFGVREHAMGGILNGLAVHGGTIPFGATFLIFSDYMRPSIRLAALMGLHVIYIFTHDSIGLGEDGPTHQPVEQLASLRAIPKLTVIRPADANETAVAWRVAIETQDRPTALILTRQNVPTLDQSVVASAEGLRRGAYVLTDSPEGEPELILMATGSEVSLILEAQKRLLERNIRARTVSMPSWELFEAQPQAYRNAVFPTGVRARLAVEAGVALGWHRYVGDAGCVISTDRFGASAPGSVVLREYGFTVENVYKSARALLQERMGEG